MTCVPATLWPSQTRRRLLAAPAGLSAQLVWPRKAVDQASSKGLQGMPQEVYLAHCCPPKEWPVGPAAGWALWHHLVLQQIRPAAQQPLCLQRLSLSGAQAVCQCRCCPLAGRLNPQMLLLMLHPALKGPPISVERR